MSSQVIHKTGEAERLPMSVAGGAASPNSQAGQARKLAMGFENLRRSAGGIRN